jgi:hypothetical protein
MTDAEIATSFEMNCAELDPSTGVDCQSFLDANEVELAKQIKIWDNVIACREDGTCTKKEVDALPSKCGWRRESRLFGLCCMVGMDTCGCVVDE